MSLLGQPIPPLDHEPHPHGAPPGIAVDFDALRAHDGTDRPWWQSRPKITPRTIVVHTNAAPVEATLAASINWGNMGKNNTKPTYNINAPQPTKSVPSDRRCIANSTGSEVEEKWGEVDSSFWSLAIETADMGTKNTAAAGYPAGDMGPFLYDHAELVARILAYEAIVWDIPLALPSQWNKPGVVCHVWPFGPRHFTIHWAKSCPGPTKIGQIVDEILPRSREIHAAWTNTQPTQEDDGMKATDPVRNSDSRGHYGARVPAGTHEIGIDFAKCGIPDDCRSVEVGLTIADAIDNGHAEVWSGNGPYLGTSSVNFTPYGPNSNCVPVLLGRSRKLALHLTRSAHVVIDVRGYEPAPEQ